MLLKNNLLNFVKNNETYYFFLLFFLPQFSHTSEQSINEIWCLNIGGESQYRSKDGTYIDCLTKDFAIEAEYDYNWKESIGQALHYAESTNKKAGILFIKRSSSTKDYYNELMRVINKYNLPIKIFVIHE